ncbi:DUF305 domain-containing protein [Nocardia sp. alder85J]|uniref:DUF305 domain-containing protein n=1 Tax=Nocardia sp. alder85J TaxID=2862949 RepID=UPI001CD41463|nr:DUF305 domain-containing protein [Nocardia sp. alder85J]MCX4097350.1 DUF305 domain-containing protein [Nocardia sp. alder85J]
MSEELSDDDVTTAAPGHPAGRQRTALLILAAVGLLLAGFAIGLIARMPLQDKGDDAAPSAVDVGFCQDMSVHHTQAVQMAAFELSNGSDADVKRLAYDIVTTQQNQVGRMQGWLQLWGKPLLGDSKGYMGWMTEAMNEHDHGATHAMPGPMATMPGMASDQEMEQLRTRTGTAEDTLFLQLMLRHHQGGVSMIDYAIDHAVTDAVRTLAQSMSASQTSEMQLISGMLTARGATPLPMS